MKIKNTLLNEMSSCMIVDETKNYTVRVLYDKNNELYAPIYTELHSRNKKSNISSLCGYCQLEVNQDQVINFHNAKMDLTEKLNFPSSENTENDISEINSSIKIDFIRNKDTAKCNSNCYIINIEPHEKSGDPSITMDKRKDFCKQEVEEPENFPHQDSQTVYRFKHNVFKGGNKTDIPNLDSTSIEQLLANLARISQLVSTHSTQTTIQNVHATLVAIPPKNINDAASASLMKLNNLNFVHQDSQASIKPVSRRKKEGTKRKRIGTEKDAKMDKSISTDKDKPEKVFSTAYPQNPRYHYYHIVLTDHAYMCKTETYPEIEENCENEHKNEAKPTEATGLLKLFESMKKAIRIFKIDL